MHSLLNKLKVRSAVSYGALCGSSCWALTQSYFQESEDYWSCSNYAFALVTVHALLGFWKYGRVRGSGGGGGCGGVRVPKLYRPLTLVTNVYTVPLICVDMYLFNYFTYELAYLHLVYPGAVLFAFFRKRKPSFRTIDVVNFVSLTSLSFISAMSRNYFGLAAAFAHALAHYVVTRAGKTLGINSKNNQNFVMSLFVFFSLQALIAAETRWAEGPAASMAVGSSSSSSPTSTKTSASSSWSSWSW